MFKGLLFPLSHPTAKEIFKLFPGYRLEVVSSVPCYEFIRHTQKQVHGDDVDADVSKLRINCHSVISKLAAVPKMPQISLMMAAVSALAIARSFKVLSLLRIAPAGLELEPPEDPLVLLRVLAHCAKVSRFVNSSTVTEGGACTADGVGQCDGGNVVYMPLEMLMCTMKDVEIDEGMQVDMHVRINGCSALMQSLEEQPNRPLVALSILPGSSAAIARGRAEGLRSGKGLVIEGAWLAPFKVNAKDLLDDSSGATVLHSDASKQAKTSVEDHLRDAEILVLAREERCQEVR